MSSLGKIFLGIAFAGVVAIFVAGYFVAQKLTAARESASNAQAGLVQVRQQVARNKADMEAAVSAKAQMTKDLDEANAKVADLTEQMNGSKQKINDLTTNVATIQGNADKVKADLQTLTDALGGQTIAQFKAQVQKAQDDLSSAESQQKILADQLEAAQQSAEELKDELNRKATGTMPPGISGKVTAISRTWNFVVLNVGIANKIVPNGELYVYRGNSLLGKVKVTRVEQDESVADILPSVKDIQVGDSVLN